MEVFSFFLWCIALNYRANDENALEIDFGATDVSLPHLALSSSVGNGVSYISKFLTTKLSNSPWNAQSLIDYLLTLEHQGDV